MEILKNWSMLIGITIFYVFITALCSKMISKNYTDNIKEKKILGTRWLIFYTQWRVLIGLVFGLIGLKDLTGIFIIIQLIHILFLITMLVTTLNRTELGYKLILISIAFDMFIISVNSITEGTEIYSSFMDFIITYIFSISAISLIWGIPNYIYFMKRKNLFFKENKNSVKEYEHINSIEKSGKFNIIEEKTEKEQKLNQINIIIKKHEDMYNKAITDLGDNSIEDVEEMYNTNKISEEQKNQFIDSIKGLQFIIQTTPNSIKKFEEDREKLEKEINSIK